MLFLQNNIEIVSGAKYHCLYDLNTGKLYHLDSLYLDYLLRAINEADTTDVPNEVLKGFLDAKILVHQEELTEEMHLEPEIGPIDFAWVEITQKCNMFCKHCYEGSSCNVKKPEMTMEDFRIAIESLLSIGVRRIQLIGGEPLMHSHFSQMLGYVAGKFDFIEIFSNGVLLTDALLEQIREYNISLAFSVYAEEARLHDDVTRVGGSYNLTTQHIRAAIEKGIKVRIASVEMVGVPKFKLWDPSIAHKTDLPRITGRAGLHLYNRDMLKRKLITKETFQTPIDPASFYKNRKMHNCFGEKLYIACDLTVYPCSMERRVSYGNLHTTSIENVCKNEYRGLTKDQIEGCRNCEFRYACFDCRSDSNGAAFTAKPWYCTYDPLRGEWENIDAFVDSFSEKLK